MLHTLSFGRSNVKRVLDSLHFCVSITKKNAPRNRSSPSTQTAGVGCACCSFETIVLDLPLCSFLDCGKLVSGIKLARSGSLVIKVPVHLPTAQIELTLCAAVQTDSIGMTVVRKRPADLQMPATEHSRHPVTNFCENRRPIDLFDIGSRDG